MTIPSRSQLRSKPILILLRVRQMIEDAIDWCKQEIFATNQGSMKAIVALACTAGTIFIGLAYAKDVYVNGWQLGTWGACVIVLAVALIPRLNLKAERAWLIYPSLLVTALALRLPMLDQIPGGLHVDEIGFADFTLRQVFIRAGQTISPFVTGQSSQPTLYHYILRLTLYLFGLNIPALRVSSAIAGSLAVLATYAAVATLQNRRVALFSAILMACYHYHIHWSRLAMNNIWDTLWVPLMVAAYAWGWKKGWSGGAVIAGLAVGLSQYFYAGSKIGLFLMAFLIFWLWRQQTPVKNRVIYLGKFLVTALCVAAPMIFYILFNTQIYLNRPAETFGWSADAIRVITGDPINLPAYIWYQITHTLGAYTFYTDITGFYGPGVPFLIGLSAPLFIIGFFWAIYKRNWIPVLWVALVSLFGGFLLAGNPSSSHYVASIPALCWLVAVPLDWLSENGRSRLAFLLLTAIVFTDLYFYFGIYVPGKPYDLTGAFPLIN